MALPARDQNVFPTRKLTASTMILDMLTAFYDYSLSTASLRTAGTVFDITEHNIRVAITRLLRSGKIMKTTRGYYQINRNHNQLIKDAIFWPSKLQATRPWNQGWIGVCDTTIPRSKRPLWNKHKLALDLRGFATLPSGMHIRPNNLVGDLETVKSEFLSLGLNANALVTLMEPLSAGDQATALSLWSPREIEDRYDKSLSDIEKRLCFFDTADLRDGARAAFFTGQKYIRSLISDPLLPEEMIDTQKRDALKDAIFAYQTKAKKGWAAILFDC